MIMDSNQTPSAAVVFNLSSLMVDILHVINSTSVGLLHRLYFKLIDGLSREQEPSIHLMQK